MGDAVPSMYQMRSALLFSSASSVRICDSMRRDNYSTVDDRVIRKYGIRVLSSVGNWGGHRIMHVLVHIVSWLTNVIKKYIRVYNVIVMWFVRLWLLHVQNF